MATTLNTDVREFVLKTFPLARKRAIHDAEPLLESGIVDSQGILELVTFIEGEYGITVPDDDLAPENFQTIDRISAYIESRTELRS